MRDGESITDAIDELRVIVKIGPEHEHNEPLRRIFEILGVIVAQLDDLEAAVAAVSGKLTQLDADVKALPVGTSTPTDLTAVLTAVSGISSQVDAIDAEVKALATPTA